MRFIGLIFVVCAFAAFEAGDGISWGIIFMGLLGIALLFPDLLKMILKK
jgi:hypothetical protein